MQLQEIHVYPLKSARGQRLHQTRVEARGLAGDRRWMLVDGEGRFVSARTVPRLVLITATLQDQGLRLMFPGAGSIEVAMPLRAQPTIAVSVWQSRCPARVAAAAASRWLSDCLGQACTLVHMEDDCLRPIAEPWARPGAELSFADGFPLLLIGSASLDELNRRLQRPVDMRRFRPNLVIATDTPFIEDRWRRLRIAALAFEVAKPCTRCVLTTVDPDTGIRAEDGEPLRTLAGFRRAASGVLFGQNLIPSGPGGLSEGDEVVAD